MKSSKDTEYLFFCLKYFCAWRLEESLSLLSQVWGRAPAWGWFMDNNVNRSAVLLLLPSHGRVIYNIIKLYKKETPRCTPGPGHQTQSSSSSRLYNTCSISGGGQAPSRTSGTTEHCAEYWVDTGLHSYSHRRLLGPPGQQHESSGETHQRQMTHILDLDVSKLMYVWMTRAGI